MGRTIFWSVIAFLFIALFIRTLCYYRSSKKDRETLENTTMNGSQQVNGEIIWPYKTIARAIKHIVVIEGIGFIVAAVAAFDAIIFD